MITKLIREYCRRQENSVFCSEYAGLEKNGAADIKEKVRDLPLISISEISKEDMQDYHPLTESDLRRLIEPNQTLEGFHAFIRSFEKAD